MLPENKSTSWLDHSVHKAFPNFTIETLFIILILLTATFSRFYDLGARVMSHDETNHVVPSYNLYTGDGYSYDPVTHGPLQFHLIALSYFILGDSDFSSRIPAALLSIAAVAFAIFGFRRYLGRTGSLIAGFLFLISPYMLFYGRYARDEALYIFFVLMWLWAMLRFLETGSKKYLLWVSAAMGLCFVTMESAYIYTAQALLFVGLLFVERITRRQWPKEGDRRNFIYSVGLLILSAVASLATMILGKNPAATATSTATTTTTTTSTPTASIFSSLYSYDKPILILCLLIVIASAVAAIYFLFRGAGEKRIRDERSFDLLMVQLILVFPLLVAFPIKMFGFDPLDYSTSGIMHSATFLVPMVIIAIALGWWWNPKKFLANAAVFYAIFTIFYTTFFTNGSGFFTGVVGALGYWLAQQAVQRGSQPWYYYALIQIPTYEFLPALGAILAFIIACKRGLWLAKADAPYEKPEIVEFQTEEEAETVLPETANEPQEAKEGDPDLFVETPEDEPEAELVLETRPVPTLALLVFWSITSLVAFSIAGEKMPWLTVNPDLPILLLSGWGLGYLIDTAPWERIKNHKLGLTFALFVIFIASLGCTVASVLGNAPPFQGHETAQLENTSTFLMAIAGLLVSGYFLYRQVAKWMRADVLRLIVLVLFAFMAVLTIRTSIRAAYVNYDNAEEFLVYAHGATGSKDILNQVQEISFRTTGGKNISVAYDSDALYPFWWYFRDYPNKVYFTTPTRDLKNSVIVIVGETNESKVEAILGDAYYSFDYTRLWWPMQDYFNLTWDRIWNAVSDPQMRTAIFNIWFNRDYTLYASLTNNTSLTVATWQPSAHFKMFIRKDIVSQMWNYGVAASSASVQAAVDPYAAGHVDLSADVALDTTNTSAGALKAPRQMAFASDGSIYVADSQNNRIVHMSADGKIIKVWGTFADILKGSAPAGTFNEPWGIAVGSDGSVFVADTFNFRIQKFTADGTFVKMWGYFGQAEKPEAFYGPRGLAIDSKGRLYVTDTGNKRIVIFDEDGNYLSQFGSNGPDVGQFDEPVGVAVDSAFNVYVTDTWNQRVQVFSQDSTGKVFTPLTQWDISGWVGQSLENKPFIAVDANNNVFITDPEASLVLEFDSKGKYIRSWGQPGSDMSSIGEASGLAFDANGKLWVSDAVNNRLLEFSVLAK